VHFSDFLDNALLRDSFWNSIYVAAMTVVVASLIAVPLATIIARFNFRGAALIHTLGVVPLVMPPFVGAVAMQLIYGRNGSINLLLNEWFGFRIPFMEGLNGVIFVEALHYSRSSCSTSPASLSNIDSAMEESAQNLGAHGFTLFRRIVFPLALPGYVAGAALVFVKVFDDPRDPAAAQRHQHAGAAGVPQDHVGRPQRSDGLRDLRDHDPVLARRHGACGLGIARPRLRDPAARRRLALPRTMGRTGNLVAGAFVVFILLLVLSPHIGIFLLSIATVWSYAVLPDGFTLAHYENVFREAGPLISNTILYCGLAGLIDVVLGATLAYVVLRTRLPGRKLVEQVAMSAVAVPGLVLGIGLLRTYLRRAAAVLGESLATFWFMLVIAYAVRRLPYALSRRDRRAAAAPRQPGGGGGKSRRRQVHDADAHRGAADDRRPAGGLRHQLRDRRGRALRHAAAGRARADAPLAYGIYVYMQSAAGRGPGAALGVIAVRRGRHRHLSRLRSPSASAASNRELLVEWNGFDIRGPFLQQRLANANVIIQTPLALNTC
jgi:iron(III) transport system permease protein